VTDDGTKKSAKGLIQIIKEKERYELRDQVSWKEEQKGELKEVFRDGNLLIDWRFEEVRANRYTSTG